MTNHGKSKSLKRLVKMMESHLKTLELSSSDAGIINAYAAVIDFIDMEGESIIDFGGEFSDNREFQNNLIEEAKKLPLDSIEKIVLADDVPKRNLEIIAVHRFGVPKGSLRSLGTKENLREKVLVAVRNQRVHQTIGEVAKMDHSKKS